MTEKLSVEDRILWNRVARTATPLRGKELDLASESEPVDQGDRPGTEAPASAPRDLAPLVSQSQPTHAQPLDRPTRNKLSKERLPIEAKVDLHGLNQNEAHVLLLSFLHRAHAVGIRHVLVITGKGSSFGSDGILRRAVPAWFSTPPFQPLVSGYDNAARRHGGAGALYVRLRRQAGKRNP